MTITYTEPQPVNIAVDDSPQSRGIEEDVEEGSFAELLAGLLQKTEFDETDVEAADFSAGEEVIQLFTVIDTDRISAFDNDAEPLNPQTDSLKLFLEKDFSEIEVPEEQASFLVSAEHLFARSNDQKIGDEETGVGFLQELPEIETEDFLLAEQEVDFPSFRTDPPKTETAQAAPPPGGGVELTAQTAAAQKSEESPPIETGKKERAPSKDAKVETRPENSRTEELAASRKEPEKAGLNRLDEARSRRRDRVAFDIRDQRTTTPSNMSNNTEMRINAGVETVSGRQAQADSPVREITLELRVPQGQNQQAQTTWEVRSGNALENMLARELHQNFNGDIIRHASMALRDGGEATIRLALKPDTLGNVKIQLELAENKVTGRIVVESEEAFNAFRKEIASLEQAFRDSGFTNADLNLSLAADSRNAGGQEQEMDSWTPRNVASRYDSSPEGADQDTLTVDVFFGHRPGSINMFA